MKPSLVNFKIEYFSSAQFCCTATPHYSWEIENAPERSVQKGYRIKVLDYAGTLFFDSGFVESPKSFGILHEGTPLAADSAYTLTLEVLLKDENLSLKVPFRTGMLDKSFPKAQWIEPTKSCTSALLRNTFFTGRRPAFATAYVAARGFYELYLNGRRVSDRILAPSMLCPEGLKDACCTDAYDITPYLSADNNTAALLLGRGYHADDFNPYGWTWSGNIRCFLVVSVVYEDGERAVFSTGDGWLWHESPILENSIYHGEVYDKNREIPNFSDPFLDTSDWLPVRFSETKETPRNLATVPIKRLKTEKCTHFEVREDEVTFCDFLKNGSGFLRIKVTGEPGTRVVITHAENIFPDGRLNTFTNRNAAATDVYILKGHEIEIYEPRFTFHCFRYAEIRMDGVAQLISAEKVTIGSNFEDHGSFWCDDPMLQRMYENGVRSMHANLLSYPQDCASRDERTPCLMDNMAYEEFAMQCFQMHGYYKLWLENALANRDENGRHPNWNGELIVLPHLLGKYYGDHALEEALYPDMKRCILESEETYRKNGFLETFGDWCAPKADNPENDYKKCSSSPGEVGLCLLYHQLGLMADLAKRLGFPSDAEYYKERRSFYQNEYYRLYWDASAGAFSGGRQTPNLLALAYDVVRTADRERVYAALKRHILMDDRLKLTTGIAGTKLLVRVLSADADGRTLLNGLLHSTEYPSFGHQIIKHDATTLFEQWDGLCGMMSCNHPMFGGIFADWYRIFAGITPLTDGYEKIQIAPRPPQSVREIRCTLHSVKGKISVFYRKVQSFVYLDVSIPVGCTAKVVLESGKTVEVGCGQYMISDASSLI